MGAAVRVGVVVDADRAPYDGFVGGGVREFLVGNKDVDCCKEAPLLLEGASEPFGCRARAVDECIRKGGKGGGFICTSSNSIHSGVPGENYVTFVRAIREFGKYPLDLD